MAVKGDVLINIGDLESHTLDCNLSKPNVKNKDLHIKTFDKTMMSNGYNKIIANRSICKCTYSKHNFGARISNWEILFLCNG